jgi:glycosyltransferase involved in cell wall biosynthesis
MKILLVGHVPPHMGGKDHGGVAQHLWDLAQKLSETNDVEILAIGRYYGNTERKKGILIHGLDPSNIGWGKCLFKIPKLLPLIGKAPSLKINLLSINSLLRLSAVENILEKFDVIHIHGWKDLFLYSLKILDIKVPSVITMHSYHGFISIGEQEKESRIAFINRYYTLCDALIHVSEADRNKGKRLGLVFNGEDRVVHNGIDVSENSVTGERSGICFVGSLIPRKRISLLLDSISFLNSDIQKLNVIGDGPQKKEVEKAREMHSGFQYYGVIPNTEVRKILSSSTVLVVPSVSESFGLAYIEALFEGAAVVGYGPTVKEFQEMMKLTEEEKKLLVPFPGGEAEPELLAEKIESAYTFRESSEGDKAMKTLREKAIRHFGWDSAVKKIEAVYKQITY